MPSEYQVLLFLENFIVKLGIWGFILRTNRINDKNTPTLLALQLDYTQVKEILKELKLEDYSDGPLPDTQYNISDMWIFGKMIKEKEVYIKIQLGRPGSEAICISFHFPEYKMKYPFKK